MWVAISEIIVSNCVLSPGRQHSPARLRLQQASQGWGDPGAAAARGALRPRQQRQEDILQPAEGDASARGESPVSAAPRSMLWRLPCFRSPTPRSTRAWRAWRPGWCGATASTRPPCPPPSSHSWPNTSQSRAAWHVTRDTWHTLVLVTTLHTWDSSCPRLR